MNQASSSNSNPFWPSCLSLWMRTATEKSVPAPESHLICVKDQGKNKKMLQKDLIAKTSPPACLGQAEITDNIFHISQREVIYPSQGRPMMAVMLCGCTGYVMMSFQRRNQRLASVWGGLVVLVFFKFCLHFLFFFLLFFFFFFIQNLLRDVSKPNLSPRAFPPHSLFHCCPVLAPGTGSLLGNG